MDDIPKEITSEATSPRKGQTSAAAGKANEGEGNRTAARAYNDATRSFIASGKVPLASKEAFQAIEGPEGDELRRAEEEGKRHSHGEDPELRKPAQP